MRFILTRANRVRIRVCALCLALLCTTLVPPGAASDKTANCGLGAAGYYLAVKARLQDDDLIDVFGASNLPPGSIVTINIYDYIGEGSHILNEPSMIGIGDDGTFRAGVQSAKGKKFKANDVCDVVFSANYPKQPSSVLEVVGPSGRNLGKAGMNPQVQDNSRNKVLVSTVVVRD